jgi:predicted nucleic acid-binding protein
MNYLLDTCVLSELVKSAPTEKVLTWLGSKQAHQLYISSITWAELHRGVAKLPASKRRNELSEWLADLDEQFGERKLPFSAKTAEHWALMIGALESQGKTMPVIDSLICATAQHYNMTLVTRNTKDFVNAQVLLIDPWQ